MLAPPQRRHPRPSSRSSAALRELGFAAFLVGGCVRDMVLRGARPRTSTSPPARCPQEVQRAFRKVIPTGIQHGTVTVSRRHATWRSPPSAARATTSTAAAPLASTSSATSCKDLSRRDFTINAMALRPGRRRAGGPLRWPGGPRRPGSSAAWATPTSASPRTGCAPCAPCASPPCSASPSTRPPEAAIPTTLPVFRKVALERIREELVKLLISQRAEPGLALLAETGLLEVFLPELARADARGRASGRPPCRPRPPTWTLRLAALLVDLVTGARRPGTSASASSSPTRSPTAVGLLVEHATLEARPDDADPALRRWLARWAGPAPESLAGARAARSRSARRSGCRAS